MSIVVGFDTATDRTALAIGERAGDDVAVVLERDFDAPRAALSRLLPELQEALARAQLVAENIDEVVVGLGPGSFTGVRIGVSTAKGLAHALGVPLYGVGTLEAVALRCCDSVATVAVVGDAMRGEVYPMLFDCARGGVSARHEECVGDPLEVATRWAEEIDGQVLLTGNGLAKYGDVFGDALGTRASVAAEYLWDPSGRAVLSAYVAARARGESGDGEPATVLPIYTRLSDAEEAEREPGRGVEE
jgi:N6-L-threonylcarbamoyladenine synthase